MSTSNQAETAGPIHNRDWCLWCGGRIEVMTRKGTGYCSALCALAAQHAREES